MAIKIPVPEDLSGGSLPQAQGGYYNANAMTAEGVPEEMRRAYEAYAAGMKARAQSIRAAAAGMGEMAMQGARTLRDAVEYRARGMGQYGEAMVGYGAAQRQALQGQVEAAHAYGEGVGGAQITESEGRIRGLAGNIAEAKGMEQYGLTQARTSAATGEAMAQGYGAMASGMRQKAAGMEMLARNMDRATQLRQNAAALQAQGQEGIIRYADDMKKAAAIEAETGMQIAKTIGMLGPAAYMIGQQIMGALKQEKDAEVETRTLEGIQYLNDASLKKSIEMQNEYQGKNAAEGVPYGKDGKERTGVYPVYYQFAKQVMDDYAEKNFPDQKDRNQFIARTDEMFRKYTNAMMAYQEKQVQEHRTIVFNGSVLGILGKIDSFAKLPEMEREGYYDALKAQLASAVWMRGIVDETMDDPSLSKMYQDKMTEFESRVIESLLDAGQTQAALSRMTAINMRAGASNPNALSWDANGTAVATGSDKWAKLYEKVQNKLDADTPMALVGQSRIDDQGREITDPEAQFYRLLELGTKSGQQKFVPKALEILTAENKKREALEFDKDLEHVVQNYINPMRAAAAKGQLLYQTGQLPLTSMTQKILDKNPAIAKLFYDTVDHARTTVESRHDRGHQQRVAGELVAFRRYWEALPYAEKMAFDPFKDDYVASMSDTAQLNVFDHAATWTRQEQARLAQGGVVGESTRETAAKTRATDIVNAMPKYADKPVHKKAIAAEITLKLVKYGKDNGGADMPPDMFRQMVAESVNEVETWGWLKNARMPGASARAQGKEIVPNTANPENYNLISPLMPTGSLRNMTVQQIPLRDKAMRELIDAVRAANPGYDRMSEAERNRLLVNTYVTQTFGGGKTPERPVVEPRAKGGVPPVSAAQPEAPKEKEPWEMSPQERRRKGVQDPGTIASPIAEAVARAPEGVLIDIPGEIARAKGQEKKVEAGPKDVAIVPLLSGTDTVGYGKVPLVYEGKRITKEEARQLVQMGKLQPLETFDTEDEANASLR